MDFTSTLLEWFGCHQRSLPWKEDGNPYKIWVSEVILQQTRVQQGLAYYQRFLEAFPTVEALAAAPEDQVLKVWQGLGYYSRARNMHRAAQVLVAQHKGVFPRTVAALEALPGVGPYTARALAAFAFNAPVAALDGNGYRILARFFAVDLPPHTAAAKKAFAQLAAALLPPSHASDFNQALMDFGSLVCLPKPLCAHCPLSPACQALAQGMTHRLPVGRPKATPHLRYFYYIDFRSHAEGVPATEEVPATGTVPPPGKQLFLRQRPGGDIWQGLYEFPLIESPEPLTVEDVLAHPAFTALMGGAPFVLDHTITLPLHKLSHQSLQATFLQGRFLAPGATPQGHFIPVTTAKLSSFAIPRLIDKYLSLSL